MKRLACLLVGVSCFSVVESAFADEYPIRYLGGRNGRYWGYGYAPYYATVPDSNVQYPTSRPGSPVFTTTSYAVNYSPPIMGTPIYANGWYGNFAYGTGPWTARAGAVIGAETSPATTVSYSASPRQEQWGLRIDELKNDGAAKQAKLEKGDIIIGVGRTRTQTLADIRNALANRTGPVDIAFWNVDTKRVERVFVTPVNGMIGVTVNPIDLP